MKILPVLLIAIFFLPLHDKASAENAATVSPDQLKASTEQAANSAHKGRVQSKISASNPNPYQVLTRSVYSGAGHYDQTANQNIRTQYQSVTNVPSRNAKVSPFSISAFVNSMVSPGRTSQAQSSVEAQRNSVRYGQSKNISAMDYFRTKILRLQR